jgi:WhiB family redox-sensing transcriptional regulator
MSTEWLLRAACGGGHDDPETYFPRGQGYPLASREQEAKRVCARCPVREECLAYAIDNDLREGIWGGLTDNERRPLDGRLVVAPGQTPTQAVLAVRDRLEAYTADGLGPKDIGYLLGVSTQAVAAALDHLHKTENDPEPGPTAGIGKAAA